MTELVRQYAGDLVGVLSFREQTVKKVDSAAR